MQYAASIRWVSVPAPPAADRRPRLAAAHLYAITADADPDRVVEVAQAVLRGGADLLQLRHKTLARGRLLELAQRLRTVTAEASALLIVNDHLDIALLAEADGVHLGDDDLSVAEARRLAGPGFLVGASASTPDAARAAVTAGADYLGAGPAFATPIKAAKPVIGPAGVAAVQAAVPVPVFAIGGVEPAKVAALVAAGIRRACMIRGLAEAGDPEAVARQVRAVLAGAP
jgi:thiamine-phosphate pyrophosphorylase